MARKNSHSQSIWYIFLLPALLGIVIFMLYPVLESFRLSFFSSNGTIEKFAGFNNYKVILSLDVFWKAVYNTFYIAFFQLLITIPVGFILATAINNLRRGQNLFKVIFYIPNVTSVVAAAMVFMFVLHPGGLLNNFLSIFGIPPVLWLSNPTTARRAAIILGSWQSLGFIIIISLANLQAIPLDYYEAATIDGSTNLESFKYITIPLMKPTFAFLTVMGWINGLQRFTDVYILGGLQGSPARSLHTMVGFIFERGFGGYEFGIASAASYILFFLIFNFTFINVKITKMKI
jgi:lactose/L-arabinose transport system permease protein